jgi:hypothetical protein
MGHPPGPPDQDEDALGVLVGSKPDPDLSALPALDPATHGRKTRPHVVATSLLVVPEAFDQCLARLVRHPKEFLGVDV